MKLTKNRKKSLQDLDLDKLYDPVDAIKILKCKSYVRFD